MIAHLQRRDPGYVDWVNQPVNNGNLGADRRPSRPVEWARSTEHVRKTRVAAMTSSHRPQIVRQPRQAATDVMAWAPAIKPPDHRPRRVTGRRRGVGVLNEKSYDGQPDLMSFPGSAGGDAGE
jgi:hypothetical protein